MNYIENLRKWSLDPTITTAFFTGLPPYAERTVYAESLQHARNGIAMLVSCISLTLDAERFESAGEQADHHHQVAKEAAENALHYCEELLRTINGGENDQASV